MTKNEAVKLLGCEKHFEAAELLGLTKGAFSMWPEILTEHQEDRVIGAAVRLNKLDAICEDRKTA